MQDSSSFKFSPQSSETGSNLSDELVHIATEFVQRPKHRRYEDRCRSGCCQRVELFSNLITRSGQTGIPSVVGVASHTGCDRVGQAIDFGLFVGDQERHVH